LSRPLASATSRVSFSDPINVTHAIRRAANSLATLMVEIPRRRFLLASLSGLGIFLGAGCGTVLHPERRGQPGGPLDWKIVALDAVGLLFFFVPGVIAFAVDFATGAIYLPAGQYGIRRRKPDAERLVEVPFPKEPLSIETLERVVSRHTRRTVELTPGEYLTEPLATLDEFWPAATRLGGEDFSPRVEVSNAS
jgi:hypothetical protein